MTVKRTMRVIAEAVARMLQNFQPIGKDAELVMLVEGLATFDGFWAP